MLLKQLVQDRHWQTYRMFCTEYNKAARSVDRELVGSYPSRAQLHRWLHGDLKGLPYAHHCRVLEAMFPGVRAAQMFEPVTQKSERIPKIPHIPHRNGAAHIDIVADEQDLAGQLVCRSLDCVIDIDPGGLSAITYKFELTNLTDWPIKRMAREAWFETTKGRLSIEPRSEVDGPQVKIHRIHDTGNMSKFACAFSPVIGPGETRNFGYVVSGGIFTHDHYFRQSVPAYMQKLTLTLKHRSVAMLVNCMVIVDNIDGSQESVIDDLDCLYDDGDALIAVVRENLKPGEALTVRWEVSR
ncbi:MAG: hypothetical protein ACRDRH_11170 [Pseudonocardia sp.]